MLQSAWKDTIVHSSLLITVYMKEHNIDGDMFL